MANVNKRVRNKDVANRRCLSFVFVTLLGVMLLVFVLRTNGVFHEESPEYSENRSDIKLTIDVSLLGSKANLPKQSELSILLEKQNELLPKNLDLFPKLPKDHIVIVLYVHNRPQYLQVVVESLSRVVGISETLLIVSHDGYFDEMNKLVEGIKFCRVKQIFAPYSPHVFNDSFPGVSPSDCKDKGDLSTKKCTGTFDQYGNHRAPKIVSLKHHWWWMMNTVWDGLEETRENSGHILFIEEDHFILPNAYRNLQALIDLKPRKCPDCYAANLAPSDVKSRGERWDFLFAERMGNVGYAFNRTVWRKIHRKAKEFCFFDDYNWDITMWATVYPSFGAPVYSLRGPRTSAIHFGKCGLHQGQDTGSCIDNGLVDIYVEDIDKSANINPNWEVHYYKHQSGYKAGFRGWGGWGDTRDQQLCLDFASMYHGTDGDIRSAGENSKPSGKLKRSLAFKHHALPLEETCYNCIS